MTASMAWQNGPWKTTTIILEINWNLSDAWHLDIPKGDDKICLVEATSIMHLINNSFCVGPYGHMAMMSHYHDPTTSHHIMHLTCDTSSYSCLQFSMFTSNYVFPHSMILTYVYEFPYSHLTTFHTIGWIV